VLGQTVVGMVAGVSLAEHKNPGGHRQGAARAEALEDSAVLLTGAKLP
jgi:hypothetical protein